MNHHRKPDKKDWRNFYILMVFLIAVMPWLLLLGSGKPEIKYVDVPVQSEPETQISCPVPSVPVCEPKQDEVWPDPVDEPRYSIIPKPRPLKVKPHLSKRRISKPLEYIDANGTRFYPMRSWPF